MPRTYYKSKISKPFFAFKTSSPKKSLSKLVSSFPALMNAIFVYIISAWLLQNTISDFRILCINFWIDSFQIKFMTLE